MLFQESPLSTQSLLNSLSTQDDDGFILYESRAICRYLAAKHPESGLVPSDVKAAALFEQAASVEPSNFDPSASKAGLELLKRYVCARPGGLIPINMRTSTSLGTWPGNTTRR